MAKWRKTISEELAKMGDSSNGQWFTFRETLMALSLAESDLFHGVWSLIGGVVNRQMLLEETTKYYFVFFFRTDRNDSGCSVENSRFSLRFTEVVAWLYLY